MSLIAIDIDIEKKVSEILVVCCKKSEFESTPKLSFVFIVFQEESYKV